MRADGMVTLKRNKKGNVEAWREGKKVGEVISMGDEATKENTPLIIKKKPKNY
jgi:hypothetical protein